MLDQLVALHFDGDRQPPPHLVEALAAEGIPDARQVRVPVLIRRLGAVQDLYQVRRGPERRHRRRRREDATQAVAL